MRIVTKVLLGLLLGGAAISWAENTELFCKDKGGPVSCEFREDQKYDAESNLARYSFDSVSFAQGVGFFKTHPAPFALLVPTGVWYKALREGHVFGYFSTPHKLLQRLADAQLKIVRWFQSDLEKGLAKPRITKNRLIYINRLVTGGGSFFEKRGDLDGLGSTVMTHLIIRYLSEDVIRETSEAVTELRREAGFENPDNWYYIISAFLKDEEKTVENKKRTPERRLFTFSTYSFTELLKERAFFFERYIASDSSNELKKIRERGGGYNTELSRFLYKMDAARTYNFIKVISPSHDMSPFKTMPLELNPEDYGYYLFDVPDSEGKTSNDFQPPCHGCKKRTWLTMLPPEDSVEAIYFGMFSMLTANSFEEHTEMFETAIARLNKRLKNEMSKAELLDVIARAWRDLTISHPFNNGNGRTVRLLMNGILMAYGLPPMTCHPDCQPVAQRFKDFKHEIEEALIYTKSQPEATALNYPKWLRTPASGSLHRTGQALKDM